MTGILLVVVVYLLCNCSYVIAQHVRQVWKGSTEIKLNGADGILKEGDPEAWKKNKLVRNESDYGTYAGLRPVEMTKPYVVAPCEARPKDGKLVCLPDIYYIGTSKSGTTSIYHYLQKHPLVKNIVSAQAAEARRSKEGHYWEHIESDIRNMTQFKTVLEKEFVEAAKKQMFEDEEGFDDAQKRPVLIEFTPNYFVLDHIPEFLYENYDKLYKFKFIVSLREPIGRTISSWKFKMRESMKGLKNLRDPPFNISMSYGMNQGNCIQKCYKKKSSMVQCSIQECRKRYDWRIDGRAGGYSYCAHVVKSMYAYQFLMWFRYFPKDRFFIFTMENFEKNPIGVLEQLLDFMGLPLYDPSGLRGYKDKATLIDLLGYIRNQTPHSKLIDSQVTNATIEKLTEYFKEPNDLLTQILGYDPGYNTHSK